MYPQIYKPKHIYIHKHILIHIHIHISCLWLHPTVPQLAIAHTIIHTHTQLKLSTNTLIHFIYISYLRCRMQNFIRIAQSCLYCKILFLKSKLCLVLKGLYLLQNFLSFSKFCLFLKVLCLLQSFVRIAPRTLGRSNPISPLARGSWCHNAHDDHIVGHLNVLISLYISCIDPKKTHDDHIVGHINVLVWKYTLHMSYTALTRHSW